jgi:very-long-chain enoyl-CoA reductase
MVVFHFIKREYETLFVHRFSNDTMPISGLIKNTAHYWLLLGIICMYFMLHPDYQTPSWSSDTMSWGFFALFCVAEFLNGMCHAVLRDLRKPGTTERGIPQGYGFQLVSSANYTWDLLAWIILAASTQVILSKNLVQS